MSKKTKTKKRDTRNWAPDDKREDLKASQLENIPTLELINEFLEREPYLNKRLLKKAKVGAEEFFYMDYFPFMTKQIWLNFKAMELGYGNCGTFHHGVGKLFKYCRRIKNGEPQIKTRNSSNHYRYVKPNGSTGTNSFLEKKLRGCYSPMRVQSIAAFCGLDVEPILVIQSCKVSDGEITPILSPEKILPFDLVDKDNPINAESKTVLAQILLKELGSQQGIVNKKEGNYIRKEEYNESRRSEIWKKFLDFRYDPDDPKKSFNQKMFTFLSSPTHQREGYREQDVAMFIKLFRFLNLEFGYNKYLKFAYRVNGIKKMTFEELNYEPEKGEIEAKKEAVVFEIKAA